MRYASLVGPLLGLYYPLPDGTELQQRLMLNTSRLRGLWCAVYDEGEVDRMLLTHGGEKLPESMAKQLDYDHHKVFGKAT